VEGDLKRRGQLHQLPRAVDINHCIWKKHAHHEAAGSERTRVKNVLADERKLVGAVDKIAGAGANKNMDRKAASFDCRLDESMARRQTVLVERRAQFDSGGSAFPCSQTGLQAFSGELEGDVALHASLSDGGRTAGSVPKAVFGSGPMVKTSFAPSAISEWWNHAFFCSWPFSEND
jgi:hypothetical protein